MLDHSNLTHNNFYKENISSENNFILNMIDCGLADDDLEFEQIMALQTSHYLNP